MNLGQPGHGTTPDRSAVIRGHEPSMNYGVSIGGQIDKRFNFSNEEF